MVNNIFNHRIRDSSFHHYLQLSNTSYGIIWESYWSHKASTKDKTMSVSFMRTAISTNQTKDHNQSWLVHPRVPALFKQFACFYFDFSLCYYDVNPCTDWQLYFLWVCFFDTRLKSALVLLLSSWYSDTRVPHQQYQRRNKTTCNLVTCVFALSGRLFNWSSWKSSSLSSILLYLAMWLVLNTRDIFLTETNQIQN